MIESVNPIAMRIALILATLFLLSCGYPIRAHGTDIVSLPSLQIERDLADGNDDLAFYLYWKYPACPEELRQARQLLRSGHDDEALKLFEKYAPTLPVDSNLRPTVYDEWGLLYEKMGKLNDAMQCFAGSGDKLLMARALIKLGKFEQAKTTLQPLFSPDRQATDFWRWHVSETEELRLRAAAEAGLHEDKNAIANLTKTALLYYECQTEPAQDCIRDANALLERDHDKPLLSLDSLPLPDAGRDRVVALVSHLVSSSDPFNHAVLTEILGCELQADVTGTYYSWHQRVPFGTIGETDSSPFFRGDHRFWCVLNTHVCFVREITIESLLPVGAKRLRSEPDRLCPAAATVEWQLPQGRLQITAGREGGRAVHVINFVGQAKVDLRRLNMR